MGISATGSGGGSSSGASSAGSGNKVSSGGGGSPTAKAESKAASPTGGKTEVVSASPTGTVKDKVDVSKPDEIANPYSFSPYAEQVTAEQWTKDRKPGEGQVKKDDHLIGMLENRGFSAQEIYAKDADGKTMLDRVAAANNLDNPNLIQAGQSYIIPSRNEPAETNAEASAHAQGLENAYASASADQKLGNLENQKASASSKADATAEQGNATAEAKTTQTVGDMKNSVAKASAEANATSVNGDAKADASSTQKAGAIEDSRVANSAEANAASVTGDASAKAKADQTVASATDSTVTNSAAAKAETVTGTADAKAEANTAVGAIDNSTIQNSASAERTEGVNGQAVTAGTEVKAEKADAAVVSDTAAVGPQGPATQQNATLEGAVGPASVAQVADGLNGAGTSQQKLEVEGPQVAVTQQSDAAKVEQQATNYADPATTPVDNSTANLNATGADFAAQTSTGFQASELKAEGGMAAQASDAQKASYAMEGERMTAYHSGTNGVADVSANAKEVFFQDGAANQTWETSPTGNTITGDVKSNNIIIDADRSDSVKGSFGTDQGDARVELRLPQGQPGQAPTGDDIQVPLAGGKDYLVTTGGNPNLTVDKPSGELNLHQTDLKGDGVNLNYNTGQSDLKGYVDLSNTQGANVGIQTAGGNHDVTYQGGPGSTMTVQLTGDQLPPRVVTDPGSWVPFFGSPEKGYLPGESQGQINANGFDNVVVMRGDETVWSSDPNWKPN